MFTVRRNSITQSLITNASFLWATALVVGQADDNLSAPLALRYGGLRAVVLHRHNGVIITPVHAAAIFGRLPHLPHLPG